MMVEFTKHDALQRPLDFFGANKLKPILMNFNLPTDLILTNHGFIIVREEEESTLCNTL